MKTTITITFCLLFVLIAGSLNAQYLNGRHKQKARIAQGVRSGELTRLETKNLRKDQRKIHRMTRRAKLNDGRISPRERKMIKQQRNKVDRKIYRYKHNRFERR